MSYVSIPPAYYAQMRPGTPYHPGGKGWLHANVDGWGENPNVAWAARQAAHGVGDAGCTPGACPVPPAPAFSYVGQHPFADYFRPGNAPWGQYPQGPAYAYPKPNLCPTCVGAPIAPGVGSLGAECGPCEIVSGDTCVPCPDGIDPTDFPECASCNNGQQTVAPVPWYKSPFAGAIAVGVLTAITTGIILGVLAHETKIPVSG